MALDQLTQRRPGHYCGIIVLFSNVRFAIFFFQCLQHFSLFSVPGYCVPVPHFLISGVPSGRVRFLFVAVATAQCFLAAFSAHYDLLRILVSARGKFFLSKMDIPRVAPPSIHVDHDFPDMNGPERPSNRSIINPFQRTQRPMAIPGSAAEIYAPPPLPPPKYIEEDAAGGDYGTQWRNSLDSSSFESGGSVSSRSSLRGNWERKGTAGRATGRPDYNRRTSAAMKLPSQPDMDTRYDYARHVDEGYHSLSGSSLVNQSVHEHFLQVHNRYLQRCSVGRAWEHVAPFRTIVGLHALIPARTSFFWPVP